MKAIQSMMICVKHTFGRYHKESKGLLVASFGLIQNLESVTYYFH